MNIDTADRIDAIAEELIGVSRLLLMLQVREGGEHFLTLAKVCERHGLELMELAKLSKTTKKMGCVILLILRSPLSVYL